MSKRSKLFDTIVKYTTVAILLAVPLYPKFPFIRVPGTFVSIRIEDLLIAFAGALWLTSFFPGFKKFFNDVLPVRGGTGHPFSVAALVQRTKLRLSRRKSGRRLISGRGRSEYSAGRRWNKSLNVAVAVFLAIGLTSLLSAFFITKTVSIHIASLHLLRRIEYFIPLYLGIEAVRNKKNLEFYFKVLLIVLLLAFIYGFGQRYLNWPIIITQNEEYSKGVALRWVSGSHISSTFAGHYDLATFLVMVMPIIVTSLFLLKGVKTRLILTLSSLAGIWLLVNTASRISLFSYLMAVSLSLFLVRRYKAIPIVLLISIIFIGFSGNLQARYGRLFEVGKERIQKVLIDTSNKKFVYAAETVRLPSRRENLTPTPTPPPVFEDRSTNIRLNVEWPRAIRAFSKNPLLGTGYSSITLATDNDYLRLLGEVGLLGFLAFFLIFANLVIIFLKKFPFHKNFTGLELAFVAGLFAALPGLFTNAVFIDIFEASKLATLFWLFTGMAITLVTEKHE